jgi:hypothetical protein
MTAGVPQRDLVTTLRHRFTGNVERVVGKFPLIAYEVT